MGLRVTKPGATGASAKYRLPFGYRRVGAPTDGRFQRPFGL
jgi:hypothetical protein